MYIEIKFFLENLISGWKQNAQFFPEYLVSFLNPSDLKITI